MICKNCSFEFSSSYDYCPTCSQKTNIHRLKWHDLIHDAIHYFTHADKGIFHLLKMLGTKTGMVAREFVLGKRKKYFPPINFFLIVAALYVLSSSWRHESGNKTEAINKEAPDTHIKPKPQNEKTVQIYKRAAYSRQV